MSIEARISWAEQQADEVIEALDVYLHARSETDDMARAARRVLRDKLARLIVRLDAADYRAGDPPSETT